LIIQRELKGTYQSEFKGQVLVGIRNVFKPTLRGQLSKPSTSLHPFLREQH